MSEIHSKISLDRFSPFPLLIDKNPLIANNFYRFDFYLLATPGFNYTRNYTDVILKGRQVAYKTEDDFNPGFEEKIIFFRFF